MKEEFGFARESKAGSHQVGSVSAYEPILSVQLRDRRAAWRVREYEGQPDKGCMGRCILAAWVGCRITLAGLPWKQFASWLVQFGDREWCVLCNEHADTLQCSKSCDII